MTNLNAHAKVFFPSKHLEPLQSPIQQALQRLRLWNFATKDEKIVISLLEEWYTSRTLNAVLQSWENANPRLVSEQKESLKILCYNVQGWYSRALEVIELVYKVEASICVFFTEVRKLWNTCRLSHFNTFHQKGTNRNGGVCVAVGKHLKATRVDVDIPKTVIVDIAGLSEPVRIIGIYWPHSQKRELDDLLPYLTEGTILTGGFNAAVEE